jgi:hypothetical protein
MLGRTIDSPDVMLSPAADTSATRKSLEAANILCKTEKRTPNLDFFQPFQPLILSLV